MSQQLTHVKLDDISPNPYQPRQEFKRKELEELSQSIKENGLIQPLIVRQSAVWGYELIAGERRLKAAKLAGLTEIPVIVKTISDQDSMKQAIIENLQRANLNPIEEAKAYQQLIDKNQMTHDELAKAMGKSRPYISNSLRLLSLSPTVSQALERGDISAGHARLLLSLDSQEQEMWLARITQEGLSVRQLEQGIGQKKKPAKQSKEDLFSQEQEKIISQALGLPVTIQSNKKGQGQLKISFSSLEDFNRIINKLQ